MRLEPSQQLRQEMRLKLAPKMIQSMEILQLPVMALQERIAQELSENPALVDPEWGVDEPATPEELAGLPETGDNNTEEVEEPDELDVLARLNNEGWPDDEDYRPSISRGALEEAAERRHDAMQNMPSRPETLQEYLDHQLAFLDAPERLKNLARYLIYNLDNDGYLRSSLEELQSSAPVETTVEELEAALKLVQKLDPPGIGARNLKECLLLQLTPEIPHADTVRLLLEKHLEDLQHNRLPQIEKKTGLPMEQIKEAVRVLQTLNPRPGVQFSAEDAPYVVPDVIVERDEEGNYVCRLHEEDVPKLAISRRYQRLLRDPSIDQTTKEFIRRKIESARWLIDSIQQRRNTLLKVAQAITEHQRDFLEKGPEHLHPLKMQDIADKVGIHVTTVSRAVDDKWIQTPQGIFPLKRFFGSGTVTDSGEEVAFEVVKRKLLDIIANEDKRAPLNDDELKAKLEEEGIHIARRTVTKYRKLLGIPSSRLRKEY
jgi:RNA polymerase sigma-54 factor